MSQGTARPASGTPKFKSRRNSRPSMNYTGRAFSLRDDEQTGKRVLVLPRGVRIPVVWHRGLPSDPTSVRVHQDSLGHWYASFAVVVPSEPMPSVHRAIGVDWGVRETATTVSVDFRSGEVNESNSFDLIHAQYGRRAQQKVARYQRMMARRKPPKGQAASEGYKQAQRLAAKAHKKATRQRQDDAQKWAKRVVRSHDRIAVEDFRPAFLRSTNMAKKAADGRIAAAKQALIWQATKHGRDLRLVAPANTTTDCSGCGARTKHRLPLGQRIYVCEACGLVRPRDKNSAAVMVDRAGFDPADVEGIGPVPATWRGPAA